MEVQVSLLFSLLSLTSLSSLLRHLSQSPFPLALSSPISLLFLFVVSLANIILFLRCSKRNFAVAVPAFQRKLVNSAIYLKRLEDLTGWCFCCKLNYQFVANYFCYFRLFSCRLVSFRFVPFRLVSSPLIGFAKLLYLEERDFQRAEMKTKVLARKPTR